MIFNYNVYICCIIGEILTVMNDLYSLSDLQIKKLIGERLSRERLKQNITQKSLAEDSAISISSVKNIESGNFGSFDSFLRVLRTLGLIDAISSLCEETQLSPSEYFELMNSAKKHVRKRAARTAKSQNKETIW